MLIYNAALQQEKKVWSLASTSRTPTVVMAMRVHLQVLSFPFYIHHFHFLMSLLFALFFLSLRTPAVPPSLSIFIALRFVSCTTSPLRLLNASTIHNGPPMNGRRNCVYARRGPAKATTKTIPS
ncbi:uncharacterized protein BDV17DRAFT_160788 [Aspergillus undulatus]|uniref:uncharacterized protein n=1 Tax=Aspergillus undulatus TaxID=1810928 RepID=UPI003CCDF992